MNELHVDVLIRPNKAVELIQLDITVGPNGVSFGAKQEEKWVLVGVDEAGADETVTFELLVDNEDFIEITTITKTDITDMMDRNIVTKTDGRKHWNALVKKGYTIDK